MAGFLTTDTLLTSIKTKTMCPTGQPAFSDANLISLLNEVFQIELVPWMRTIKEDFFLHRQTVSIINNVSNYTLPERSIGDSIQDVHFLDANNNRCVLPKVSTPNMYLSSQGYTVPQAYTLEGDQIVVTPPMTSGAGNYLQFFYYQRPNTLIATSGVSYITAVNTSGSNQVLTVNTDLTGSLSTGSLIDFLSGNTPFQLWAQDVSIVGITATTVTVATSAVVNGNSQVILNVGDIVCPAQYSNIPMTPQEFHPVLSEMVGARIMKALKDLPGLQAVQETLKQMKDSVYNLIANRVENQANVIFNRNSLVNSVGMMWPYSYPR